MSDVTQDEIEFLAYQFREFTALTSPLYASLASRIADHPEILSMLLANPIPERRMPVLLFASVHNEVLANPDVELAHWYGTVVDEPRTDDAFEAFADLCASRRSAIEHSIATRTVQTNEVARGAFLAPALAWIGAQLPAESPGLSIVDVGTSAGLNLYLDRYRIDYGPRGSMGPTNSPVQVFCQATSDDGQFVVPSAPTIVGRRGFDIAPIDVTDPADARWLEACTWPDERHRFARLAAAIEMAAADPPDIVAATGSDIVPDLVAKATADGYPVVMNSWVLNYFPASERQRFVDTLHRIGAGQDLSWVWAEAPYFTPNLPWPVELTGSSENDSVTELMVTTWRSGAPVTTHLATCHPHGAHFRWVASQPWVTP